MAGIAQICGCIQVLFGWFCEKSMFFAFLGILEGGLKEGCV
jgi:hypothetical protein